MSGMAPRAGRRVVILSYSDGLHDARSQRLARTLEATGCDVEIYARMKRGLAADDVVDGIPVHRVSVPFAPPLSVALWALVAWARGGRNAILTPLLLPLVLPLVVGMSALGRLSHLGERSADAPLGLNPSGTGLAGRLRAALRGTVLLAVGRRAGGRRRRRIRHGARIVRNALPRPVRWVVRRGARVCRAGGAVVRLPLRTIARGWRRSAMRRTWTQSRRRRTREAARAVRRAARSAMRSATGPFLLFPIRPLAWAAEVERVAGPADVYHGMWAGSLPALDRLKRRYGGATIYDSRDVYVHARVFDTMPRPARAVFRRFERAWASRVDAVITVNEPYADIIASTLGIERPAVVMNCPFQQGESERRDPIRARLGLDAATRVVLYSGGLMTDRGIEQGMVAIRDVENAVLVLLGHGSATERYRAMAADPINQGRVHVVPAVPPSELLDWTAAADVVLCAIQPTSLNHRYTTPQKLFEAMSVGTPVVASNLPGMAPIVEETGCGILVDPTSPPAIAAGIRSLLDVDRYAAESRRRRIRDAGADAFTWEAQEGVLRSVYRAIASIGSELVPEALGESGRRGSVARKVDTPRTDQPAAASPASWHAA